MLKYVGKQLRKGSRVIDILLYIAPGDDTHRCPCGTRRGKYACDVDGERRYILTANISRYVTLYGWTIDGQDCWLHAHHSIKHQENCTEKGQGLWNRFLNLFR